MARTIRQLGHNDYTIGWICALPETELVAAKAMLDEEHPILPAADPSDTNTYSFGRIGAHNVVIACLPAEKTGTTSAAVVAKDILRSFKSIRFGLFVGIGGGVPRIERDTKKRSRVNHPFVIRKAKKSKSHTRHDLTTLQLKEDSKIGDVKQVDNDENTNDREEIGNEEDEASNLEGDSDEEGDSLHGQDVRLGDVVISLHSKTTDAVVQYDFGKSLAKRQFVRTGRLNNPPNLLLNAVSSIKSDHVLKGHKLRDHLSEMVKKYPRLSGKFEYPGADNDYLFRADCIHIADKTTCKACYQNLGASLVERPERKDTSPQLHYGTIGSANQVMKDAVLRDELARGESIICFEMEAAGLMDTFPCLVIRGICDYADSHKNKKWQPYAAAAAAAYAKELLSWIPGQSVMNMSPIELVGDKIMLQLATWRRTDTEEKCLQAFRTTIYETQKNLNPMREPGTCLWCLHDKKFLDWRDKSTSRLLWVTADPGCGKSVLSKALVDENLLDSVSNDTVVCYYFFKDTSDEQRSPTCALSALLHQLFSSKNGARLIRHALPHLGRDNKSISRNFEAMWDIIEKIAIDPNACKIIFLLDALDECLSSAQKYFITKLKSFENLRNSATGAEGFRIFVTSRPYWDIEGHFESLISGIPSIRLRGEDKSIALRTEIDRVIIARVSRFSSQIASEKARELLLKRLLEVENRTYLWLHLVLDIIHSEPRISTKTVERVLNKLPVTVEEAYEAILQRSKNLEDAKRLLHIIVVATRPLSLKEIAVALYIEEDMQTYEDLELQDDEQVRVTIRDLCGLFVSVVESKVFLIHQTAKEYLVAPQDLEETSPESWKYSLRPTQSNCLLAKYCLWYLLFKEFEQGYSNLAEPYEKQQAIDDYCRKHCFLKYAAYNWAWHFRFAGVTDDRMIELALKACDVNSNTFKMWFGIFQSRVSSFTNFQGLDELSLAARLGLRSVAQVLLDRGAAVDGPKNSILTPLGYAAAFGRESVAELLIDRGADINSTRDFLGRTPLAIAKTDGDENDAVVRLLKARGAK